MKKTTILPGMEYMSGSEYKAFIKKERRAYRRRLRRICPSKEMRTSVKELLDYEESCKSCIYFDRYGNSKPCRAPYTDVYMDALNIDPCYEGYLLYACKEMKPRPEESGDELKKMRAMAVDNLEALDIITRAVIKIAERKELISPLMEQGMRDINNAVQEAKKDLKPANEYTFANDEWDFDIDDDGGKIIQP